jgi:uncharacterized protein YbjT (DUF2867 family)
MIIVTGANGQLGRGIVEGLLARGQRIGVSVRDPDKAKDLAARGVSVRRGDFADPASLEGAFSGATQLVMVSSNAEAYGGDMLAQHTEALAAAKAAGVKRVLYTSHMGADAGSAFGPTRNHAKVEELLAASGIPFTALRHGFYSWTPLDLAKRALATGKLVAPADGKVSWTAREDLAEADAILAASGDAPNGPTAAWTAGEALDLADVARILSDLADRPIERVIVSDADFESGLSAGGVPPHVQEIIVGLWLAARNGEFARVDPTLGKVLRREPRTMREQLQSLLSA